MREVLIMRRCTRFAGHDFEMKFPKKAVGRSGPGFDPLAFRLICKHCGAEAAGMKEAARWQGSTWKLRWFAVITITGLAFIALVIWMV